MPFTFQARYPPAELGRAEDQRFARTTRNPVTGFRQETRKSPEATPQRGLMDRLKNVLRLEGSPVLPGSGLPLAGAL